MIPGNTGQMKLREWIWGQTGTDLYNYLYQLLWFCDCQLTRSLTEATGRKTLWGEWYTTLLFPVSSLFLLFILKRKGDLGQRNRNKLALIFWWFNWSGIYQPTHPGVHQPTSSEVWEKTGPRLRHFLKGNTNQSYEWWEHTQNYTAGWVVSPEFIYWNSNSLCEVISVKP